MVTGHNKVKGSTDKAKGSTDSIVYIKSKRFSENYLPYLYYVANRINLLVRINVVKTTFTEYFSAKFGAILSYASRLTLTLMRAVLESHWTLT